MTVLWVLIETPVLNAVPKEVSRFIRMSRVSTYINCLGQTEEAFTFYSQAFGHPLVNLTRFSDAGMPLGEDDLQKILHVELEILGGHMLMGTDMLESAGHVLTVGNNISINLEPDTKEEAQRIHAALSQGATEDSGLSDMPWGAYWGSWLDKFGIRWMVNVPN